MLSAIFLAGGLGTRLRHIVPDTPKALAPICGIPFLHLLIRKLEQTGIVSEAIFALGYRAEQIEQFLEAKNYQIPLILSKETSLLGTGGALLLAKSKAKEDSLLVLNADTWFDLPLECLTQAHLAARADITMACRFVSDTSRYGAVEIDPQTQRITSFKEKTPGSGWISGGFYLIEKKLLSEIPLTPCSLETDIFPAFLEKRFFAFPHDGSFIDIGTATSYSDAQEILKPWILL